MSATPIPTPAVPGPRTMATNLTQLAEAGPAAIEQRLDELRREWSAGRVVKATLAVVVLAGMGLSYFLNNEWWLLLPAAAGLVLLQYMFGRRSLLGALVHGLGFRRGEEIEREKLALRALRGDFRHLPTVHEVEDRDATSRMEDEGGIAVDPAYAKRDVREAVQEVVEAANK